MSDKKTQPDARPPTHLELSPEERKARRERIRKEWKQLDEIPPCEFCGRLMLAGVCCDEMLEAAKKKQN